MECVFGHVHSKEEGDAITNKEGKSYGNNLRILQKRDGTFYVCLEPTILTPAICFFSIDLQKRFANIEPFNSILVRLDRYIHDMGYCSSNTSFLFVYNVKSFFSELLTQIPLAVKANANNLTTDRFSIPFDPKNPFIARNVEYGKHESDEFYIDHENWLDSMFWKQKEYEYQSEMRIVVPNINYIQEYGLGNKYDHTKNKLRVLLPSLRSYASIMDANRIDAIRFWAYDKETSTSQMCFYFNGNPIKMD